MKLPISNLGWAAEKDNQIYETIRQFGYTGLEIAPTRVFSGNPYSRLEDARAWACNLKLKNGFSIVRSYNFVFKGDT